MTPTSINQYVKDPESLTNHDRESALLGERTLRVIRHFSFPACGFACIALIMLVATALFATAFLAGADLKVLAAIAITWLGVIIPSTCLVTAHCIVMYPVFLLDL